MARSSGRGLLVAGAVGPTGLAGPGKRPLRSELQEQYGRPWSALAAAGCDLLWAETQYDLEEARAALGAARATGLPTAVTMTFVQGPLGLATPAGEDAFECLSAMAREGAAAIGINCALPGAPVPELLSRLSEATRVPLIAKPSAGLPDQTLGPGPFADWVIEMVQAGAQLVGGCCGAGPAHLRALGKRIAARGLR